MASQAPADQAEGPETDEQEQRERERPCAEERPAQLARRRAHRLSEALRVHRAVGSEQPERLAEIVNVP